MRISLALLILALLTGCGLNFGDDYTLDAATFDSKALATVQGVSRLTFPDGIRGLNMFYQGSGIDDALIAKLEIPRAAAANLAAQIESIQGQPASVSETMAEGHPWWNQDSLVVKTHRKLQVGADYLELILGEDGEKWILLVKWFLI